MEQQHQLKPVYKAKLNVYLRNKKEKRNTKIQKNVEQDQANSSDFDIEQEIHPLVNKKQKQKKNFNFIEDSRQSSFYFKKKLLIQLMLFYNQILFISLGIFYQFVLLKNSKDSSIFYYLILKSIITAMMLLLTVYRYFLIMQILKSQKIIDPQDNLYSTNYIWLMVLQLLIIFPHSNVFTQEIYIRIFQAYDGIYLSHSLNDIFEIVAIFKIYIIFRTLIINSKYASPRSSRICRVYGCQFNYTFFIKCIMEQIPLRAIFIVFICFLLTYGHGLRIAQGSLLLTRNVFEQLPEEIKLPNMDFTSYLNCYWCVLMTMGTVGYGDYFPRTLLGRIIIFATAITGVILSSLLVVALNTYLKMMNSQNKSHISKNLLQALKRLQFRKNMEYDAANALANTTKLGKLIKKIKDVRQKKGLKELFNKLNHNMMIVKLTMRKIKNMVDGEAMQEQMNRSFQVLKENLKEIYQKQCKLLQLFKLLKLKEGKKLKEINFNLQNQIKSFIS